MNNKELFDFCICPYPINTTQSNLYNTSHSFLFPLALCLSFLIYAFPAVLYLRAPEKIEAQKEKTTRKFFHHTHTRNVTHTRRPVAIAFDVTKHETHKSITTQQRCA